jgi:hypothetical protein
MFCLSSSPDKQKLNPLRLGGNILKGISSYVHLRKSA